MPQFISKSSELYSVDDVFNGIITESSFADRNVFIGKGAGAYPTASAVLSDLSALTYNYRYEYKKLIQNLSCTNSNDINLELYLRTEKFKESDYKAFDIITEEYQSSESSYIIGNINFNQLKNTGWIDNPDYSIVLKRVN
jgi:homoserine dehydrogenase